MPARPARAGKLKVMGGRLVSAKSKTGDPQCSQAMSAKVNARLGNPVSMALDVANAILGKCRAAAHRLKNAGHQRAAGHEARAQHQEAIVRRGGPVTAKDRAAKAAELRAKRASKRAAAPKPTPQQARHKRQMGAKGAAAREVRVGKIALQGHVSVESVKADRAERLRELLPVRREQQRILKQEDYRFTKTPYESSDWLRKGSKLVTKPYSYTDSKGDLPSYYGSKARAAKFLAKHNLQKAESDARAAKEAAARTKKATGRQLTGIGSATAYRYKEAAKAAFKPKGFKTQDIALAKSDNAGTATEKAQVKGIYGVHKSGYGNAYSVTHLPTGLSTGLRLDTQTRAKEIVESLTRRKIDFVKMTDTPEGRKRAKRMLMALQGRR